MKKTIAVLLSFVLLFGIVSVCAYAQEEDKYAPEKFSAEEYEAGFSFKYVNVLLKNEYSFQQFTPEILNGELIGKIETPYGFNPDNANYNENTYQQYMVLHLAEPTKENVLKLYKQMKNCKYVDVAEIGAIYPYMVIYPDSPSEIGYHSGAYRPFVEPDELNYSGNMLLNPYYKLYYNELLEKSVTIYNRFAEYITDVDYISYFAENYMNKDKNYVTLIFNEAETDKINTHNRAILNKYFTEEEILYVGDTVFAAVVCINNEDAQKITQIEELAFIGDAFFSDSSHSMSLHVTGQYALGDVIGEKDASEAGTENTVTTADARYILRYSVGLETVESDLKRFYYCADMNFDGYITTADARLALRTAVKLENEYQIVFGYSYMWNDGITINTGEQIIEMATDCEYTFGPLKNAGSGAYNWSCTTDDRLTVTQTLRSDGVVNPGDPVEQYFIFSAKEPGTYTAHFELRRSWEETAIDSFDIKVIVKQ